MSGPSNPADVAPMGRELAQTGFGLGLLVLFLTVFTVGSQVSSETYKDPKSFFDAIMFVLTTRETSVCVLSIIAACLGAWRRINQSNDGDAASTGQPWFVAYTSACIGGLITTAVVVGMPSLLDALSDQITITRDAKDGPRNYDSFAMMSSVVAYFSGYDKTFLDRILRLITNKLGASENPPAGSPAVATVPRNEPQVPVSAQS